MFSGERRQATNTMAHGPSLLGQSTVHLQFYPFCLIKESWHGYTWSPCKQVLKVIYHLTILALPSFHINNSRLMAQTHLSFQCFLKLEVSDLIWFWPNWITNKLACREENEIIQCLQYYFPPMMATQRKSTRGKEKWLGEGVAVPKQFLQAAVECSRPASKDIYHVRQI